MPSAPHVEEWQRAAAQTRVTWTGDLNDDCIAVWAGLTLRAERMKRILWWWAVYDNATGEVVVDSHKASEVARNGKRARSAAESAARSWLTNVGSSNNA